MAVGILSWVSTSGVASRLIRASSRQENFSSGFRTIVQYRTNVRTKCEGCKTTLFRRSSLTNAIGQRIGFSSSSFPDQTDKDANQLVDPDDGTKARTKIAQNSGCSTAPGQAEITETEPALSVNDLLKLLVEKEKLLELKQKEIEKMQDIFLCSYEEMTNILEWTKREVENSKKFAIQDFAKSLLDVADNLERACSVVKESFIKIDPSKDSVGVVPLLKTLLEGIEMTEKQLAEVFRKQGLEKPYR